MTPLVLALALLAPLPEPSTATFLGGSGAEYLIDAHVREDGRVLVVGVALGPTLTLPGVGEVPVIGKPDVQPTADPGTARELLASSETKPTSHIGTHPDATAFVAMFAPELSKIERAVRLPWGAVRVTGVAFDGGGGVYLCGLAGKNFDDACRATLQPGSGKHVGFVLRFWSDLSRIGWAVQFPTDAEAPTLHAVSGSVTPTRLLTDITPESVVYLAPGEDGETRQFSITGQPLGRERTLPPGVNAIDPRTGDPIVATPPTDEEQQWRASLAKVPSVGRVPLLPGGDRFRSVMGQQSGQPVRIVVTLVTDETDAKPTSEGAQQTFGGGACDGYLMLFRE